MRMSCTEAYNAWSVSEMVHRRGDGVSRMDWLIYDSNEMLKRNLDYAFQAGWTAALANLTTQDI